MASSIETEIAAGLNQGHRDLSFLPVSYTCELPALPLLSCHLLLKLFHSPCHPHKLREYKHLAS